MSRSRLPIILLALSACIDRFETETAYEGERYLCADHRGMSEAISACEDEWSLGRKCGGVVSFTGELEGQPVTIDSRLSISEFYVSSEDDGSSMIDRVDALAATPYFQLAMQVRSLHARAAESERLFYEIAERAPEGPHPAEDLRASLVLRLSSGGQSVAFSALAGSGWISVDSISEEHLQGRFSGAFGAPEDRLEGCFSAIATMKVRGGGE